AEAADGRHAVELAAEHRPDIVLMDIIMPELNGLAAAERITAEALARDLAFLASDDLRGRDTGSPGFDAAADHIIERLQAAGLTPAGDAGTYRQHYDLVEMRVDPDDSWIEIDGQRFAFGEHLLLRSFAGPIDATAPVVYIGHGWHAPDRGLAPYADVDVRGAFVLAHGPRAALKDGVLTQVGRVAVGASSVVAEAKTRGALGVLYLTSSSAEEEWPRARQATVVRELDPPVPSAYAAPPVTTLQLSAAASDALLAGESLEGAALRARGAARDYPASFRLKRHATVHVALASVTRSRPYNVVATIPGSDPALAQEVITVAAHLDGAVGAREVDGDAIYNSADDNATGSAVTLALAEQFMRGSRPKRTLIFIWDSGEERGLWGTRQFVHAPPVPLDRIVAHVNVDMVGATRAPGTSDADSPDVAGPNELFLIGPGVLSPTVDALLTRVNEAYLNMTFNRRDDRADSEFFYPRTDAGPYLERGILTIGFTTGTHPRYHLPSDEARHLDPQKMQAVARTVFASLWALGTMEERPRI
ncbi:MAG: M28 family peptidase, partial [Vicinamibacteria bacterium]